MSMGTQSNESSGSQQATGGFRDLPPEIQNAFKALATQAQSFLPGAFGQPGSSVPTGGTFDTARYLKDNPDVAGNAYASKDPFKHYTNNGQGEGRKAYNTAGQLWGSSSPVAGGGSSADMFKPMGITGMEQSALDRIWQGFAPTQDSFNADIAMQQNPWDKYVMDEINRQSMGDFSVLKQNTSQTGTFGSNRQALGANDIDLSRLNQIGGFKQGQFDKAANNAMTVLPQQRMADATAQLQGGGFMRSLDTQQKQAPLNALASIAQILGILPTNSNQSTGTQSSSGSGFNFGL